MEPSEKEQIKKNRKIVIVCAVIIIVLLNVGFYFIDELISDSDIRLWFIIGSVAISLVSIFKIVNRFKVE